MASPKAVLDPYPEEHLGVLPRNNLQTATTIAIECGIVGDAKITVKDTELPRVDVVGLDSMTNRLQVISKRSDEDKAALVHKLKQLGPITTITASTVLGDPDEALRPDPSTEADFQVENNPFAFSPGHLNKLLNPKSLSAFRALGGLRGIAHGLQTDVTSGLSLDETSTLGRVSFDEAVKTSGSAIHIKTPVPWPEVRISLEPFSMGSAGTELAKEAASKVLLDDNFDSVLAALQWGQAVNSCIRQCIRFQVTVSSVAIIAKIITWALASDATDHLFPGGPLLVLLIVGLVANVALAAGDSVANEKPSTSTSSACTSHFQPRGKFRKILLAGAALTYCTPFVAALILTASPELRVGSGVAAAASAITLIPLRTVELLPVLPWIM
nr:hypothetical protein [Paramyrothecium sp.]